jgi:hypothetical protein
VSTVSHADGTVTLYSNGRLLLSRGSRAEADALAAEILCCPLGTKAMTTKASAQLALLGAGLLKEETTPSEDRGMDRKAILWVLAAGASSWVGSASLLSRRTIV